MHRLTLFKNSGRPINVHETIGRNLLRSVDWLPAMYITGVASMMISRENQRLEDHLVGSIVVHDKRAEEIRPEWSSSPHKTSTKPQLSKVSQEELVFVLIERTCSDDTPWILDFEMRLRIRSPAGSRQELELNILGISRWMILWIALQI